MNGVPVPVVSRLLGHSSVSMTLRYAHLGDRDVEEAAERVGRYIGSKLGLGFGGCPEGVDAAPAGVSIDGTDRRGERSRSGRHRDDVMTEATGILRGVVRRTADMDWQPSPAAGVWRKRLELAGAVEAGRVTSVVRFDPGARFPRHAHPDGEEILVLDGVFSDETGDYPAGSHLLNPDGTSHAPWSGPGCTLFVKLRQYPGADRPRLAIDTGSAVWRPGPADGFGTAGALPRPGARRGARRAGPDGAGLHLVPGCFVQAARRCSSSRAFWRMGMAGTGPAVGCAAGRAAGNRWHAPEGCLLYVKQGHLGRYDEGRPGSRAGPGRRSRDGVGKEPDDGAPRGRPFCSTDSPTIRPGICAWWRGHDGSPGFGKTNVSTTVQSFSRPMMAAMVCPTLSAAFSTSRSPRWA